MQLTQQPRTISEASQEIMRPTGVVNLNAGSCSPVPKPVFASISDHLAQQCADPVGYIWNDAIDSIERGRRGLATMLGTSTDHLLFCTNASWAVNAVLQSFAWTPGDEIIMSDQEYHHYKPLFAHLEKEHAVIIRKANLPLTPPAWSTTDILALFTELKTSRTRMIFFSHITSPTGSRLPAKDLCAWANASGIKSFVDGAHAPGHIAVDLSDIRPTFYTANCHKWLMNPAGCAFLYAAPEARFDFRPLMFMSGYDAWLERKDEKTKFGFSRWHFAHEYQGTRNLTPFATLDATLNFIGSIKEGESSGLAAMREAWEKNRAYAAAALAKLNLDIISPEGEASSCMISCRIPFTGRIDPVAARNYFRHRHGIELAFPTLSSGEALLRVSAAWWNKTEDFDHLSDAVRNTDWNQLG